VLRDVFILLESPCQPGAIVEAAVSNARMKWVGCLCAFLAPALIAGPDSPFNSAAVQVQPSVRPSNVWVMAREAQSDQLEKGRSYRLYEEPQQLVIILTVRHDSLEPATADQQAFTRQLLVAVRDNDDAPVAVETAGTFWRPHAVDQPARVQLDESEPLQIAPRRSIEWELRLERADGQRFATGLHTIDFSLGGPFRALRLPDGSRLGSSNSETVLTIRLGPPTNARERGNMHALAAQKAMQERRYADAAAAAERARDADPSGFGAYAVLGGAYLQLDRCAEAVAALEKVVEIARTGRTAIPEWLAQAYVCVGDVPNAIRVLGLRDIPKAQLDAEIARRRQLIEGRRRQNPRRDH
jgi:hypothetical protein